MVKIPFTVLDVLYTYAMIYVLCLIFLFLITSVYHDVMIMSLQKTLIKLLDLYGLLLCSLNEPFEVSKFWLNRGSEISQNVLKIS